MSSPKRQKSEASFLGGNWKRPFDSAEIDPLFNAQGWLAGPRIVHHKDISATGLIINSPYSYSLRADNQDVWLWYLAVTIEVTLDLSTNNHTVIQIHFLEWDRMFDIFNIEFGVEYLHRVILENLSQTPIMSYKMASNYRGIFNLELAIPLNIRSPSPFAVSDWLLLSDGTICHGIGRLPLPLDVAFIPLNQLGNLRPCLLHYVLRCLMLSLECDTPILEAIYETWPNRSFGSGMRLFPPIKMPKYYKRNLNHTFDVVY